MAISGRASRRHLFDVPVAGLQTIDVMQETGTTLLAVDAGRTLLLDKDKLLARANEAGIGVIGWANLLRVFFICTLLFAAGDLPVIWWNVSHPVISRSQAMWAIPMMLGWIFAALLISAGIARRLPSPPR